ncbi:hypothetical protein QQX98_010045 [Neonectria punicea]|uniref:Uncharacterized protein n=1 Tax=Neonectria punicea TaxID=979145 RepID=A0ABR1GQL4_9HYPO
MSRHSQDLTVDCDNVFNIEPKPNSTLRQENESFYITNEQNFKTVARLQQQLDDRSQQMLQKESILESVTAEKKTLLHSLEAARKETVKKGHELETVRGETSQLRSNLGWLQQFLFEMQPMVKETSCKHLDDVFGSMYAIIESHFGGDVDQAILADSNCWDRIRYHPFVKDAIPLPQSNSTPAKQMRIAAILAICADALSRHVFQSTYLLNESTELSDLMNELCAEEPSKEWFLRSALLTILPRKQRENGKVWADRAVDAVMACVRPILPKEKQKNFHSTLQNICGKACDIWIQFQGVNGKIVSTMEISDADEWKPLSPPSSKTRPGRQKKAGNAQRPDGDSKEPSQAQSQPNGDDDDVGVVVWPAFLFRKNRNERVELLREGFVVTEAQMREARYEEPATRLGKRRVMRLKARSLSMSSKNGEANTGRGFLSPKDGGGSTGD